jgi:hypothetical protein
MAEKKVNFGKSKHSSKGAHGGGTQHHEQKVKYPKFMLGQGFKKKNKPGESTKNEMP